MKNQNKIYEEVTNNVIDVMSEYGTDWFKQWSGNSGLPINTVSKKAYTGINFLILTGKQMPSPIWGTIKQFQKLLDTGKPIQIDELKNYTVIIYYSLIESRTETDSKGNPKKFPMLKTYRVWNLAQTNGYVQPVEEDKPQVNFSHKDAEEWIKNSGANIRHLENRAYYRGGSSDYINMPPKENFIDTADATAEQGYWGTLFHELTHWTGHATRCNRQDKYADNSFGSKDYAFEELIAELGACFQSVKFGLEQPKVNADHIKYINSWIRVLKEDKKKIFQASAQANKGIQFIEGLQLD